MIVRSSHLALRFYRHDGWTEELVKQYVDGPVADKDFDFKSHDIAYWIPEIGTKVDAEKLVKDGHIAQNYKHEVLNEYQSLKYFEKMGW